MDDSLKKLQKLELEMLLKIVDICEKNNITYYLFGGTLIGAVRHEGFIPWDDDIDLGMPRPDYEKFLEIAESELGENYDLLTPFKNPKYQFSFSKVIKLPCLHTWHHHK